MKVNEAPSVGLDANPATLGAYNLVNSVRRFARPKRVLSSRDIVRRHGIHMNSVEEIQHLRNADINPKAKKVCVQQEKVEHDDITKETPRSIGESGVVSRQIRPLQKSNSFLLSAFPRISRALLPKLPEGVQRPGYNPSDVKPGILHVGTGNFALAHLASFIHDYLVTDKSWGIVSTSIRSDRLINLLKKQENLYVIVEKSRDFINPKAIASIVGTVFGAAEPSRIIDYIASPEIKLLTITVTNNGYIVDADLELKMDSPEIQDDLKDRTRPKTVYGYLAAGLEKRMSLDHNVPLTIMSLDNIPSNSKTLLKAFLRFVECCNRDLIPYMDRCVDFLVTLVDRITPEPTEAYKIQMQVKMGLRTFVLIGTEQYRSLVVEKGRFTVPKWETVGVKVVNDCSSYMQRKFYCLNAAHMIIAMCGCRLGCKFIHEAAAVKEVSMLLDSAFEEWLAFLPGQKQELEEYVRIVKKRVSDYSLNDAVKRVSSRVTSKIPERIVSGAIKYKEATGNPMRTAAMALAIYLHNTERKNEKGGFFEIIDSAANKAASAHRYSFNILRLIGPYSPLPPSVSSNTLLRLASSLESTGLKTLAEDEEFCTIFGNCLVNIKYKGLRAAIYLHLNLEVPSDLVVVRNRPLGPKRAASYIN